MQARARDRDDDEKQNAAGVRSLGARSVRSALPGSSPTRQEVATAIEKMGSRGDGLLCGDPGITLLDGLLHSKGFMGKRDDSEIRACAAMALGKIGSPKAMESLNKAATEKDVIVRNAVSRAIRRSPG